MKQLEAEAKLGELLSHLPHHVGSQIGKRGMANTLPPGITHNQSYHAQTLASNPEIIEEEINGGPYALPVKNIRR